MKGLHNKKMMVLITGGSGSGKSAFAEDYLLRLAAQNDEKYYIATMQPFGKESLARIERHRKLREGKGFRTIEQQREIQKALEKMRSRAGEVCPKRSALLECMSNLTANEMFTETGRKSTEWVTGQILCGIDALERELKHLVIVTNNVFEDGISYEEATMDYIEAMGIVNEKLAGRADVVIEVAAGIPIVWKGAAQ